MLFDYDDILIFNWNLCIWIYLYISGIDCFCIRFLNMEVFLEKFFFLNWIFVGRNFILYGGKIVN